MVKARKGHRFGGPWTELKLKAVADYLKFYTTALSQSPTPERPFSLWYVDAFAGTGERTVELETTALLDAAGDRFTTIQMQGSARRALDIEPPFSHFRFIERNSRRIKALHDLVGRYPGRDAVCLSGDANEMLTQIFRTAPWVGATGRGQRGVVFLDPYGMNVKWATLQMLAQTEKVDIWYLFPLHACLRQLAHKYASVDEDKALSLTEVFGSDQWESEFYRYEQSPQLGLFGPMENGPTRDANAEKIIAFARARLGEIFAFVSDPIQLLTKRRLQEFALLCLSNNPSKPARALIHKGVKHIVSKYSREASRRMSGH